MSRSTDTEVELYEARLHLVNVMNRPVVMVDEQEAAINRFERAVVMSASSVVSQFGQSAVARRSGWWRQGVHQAAMHLVRHAGPRVP
jgi:hypothetical protein